MSSEFRCPRCYRDLTWEGCNPPDWDTRTLWMEGHINTAHPEDVVSVRHAFLMDEANVPQHFRNPSPPTDPPARAAWEPVEGWVENCGDGNLLLYGGSGRGKTTVAARALDRLMALDASRTLRLAEEFYWVHVGRFVGRARQWVAKGQSENLALATEKAVRAWVLVMDDLGAERLTEFARDLIADLVESRYDADRPTVVTSNYTPDELVHRLAGDDPVVGDRLVGRLCEGALQVKVDGPDRRLENVTYLPPPPPNEDDLDTAGTANP